MPRDPLHLDSDGRSILPDLDADRSDVREWIDDIRAQLDELEAQLDRPTEEQRASLHRATRDVAAEVARAVERRDRRWPAAMMEEIAQAFEDHLDRTAQRVALVVAGSDHELLRMDVQREVERQFGERLTEQRVGRVLRDLAEFPHLGIHKLKGGHGYKARRITQVTLRELRKSRSN